jgi:hypothetical protein
MRWSPRWTGPPAELGGSLNIDPGERRFGCLDGEGLTVNCWGGNARDVPDRECRGSPEAPAKHAAIPPPIERRDDRWPNREHHPARPRCEDGPDTWARKP